MRNKLTVVDLFSGVGGFSLGFLNANEVARPYTFDVRLLVDIDPTAAFTFKKNFPKIPFWPKDLGTVHGSEILKIASLSVGELDFLVGGPPCQGFSPNGKRWLEDNRNQLISRFIQIAHQVMPRCAIIENVPAALSSYERLFSTEVAAAFTGYVVKTAVLNASAFGVPQLRKRAFIVALRQDLGIQDFTFPGGDYDGVELLRDCQDPAAAEKRYVSVGQAIGDLPALKAGEFVDGGGYSVAPANTYQADRRRKALAVFNHVARSHSKAFQRKISTIQPGETNSDLPDELRFSDNYYSQAYGRLHQEDIGLTITANFRNPGSGRFTHYKDHRSITVREAARLQSFDDHFIFYGTDSDQQRHVGNAVPPLLSRSLALHFGDLLFSAHGLKVRKDA